MYLSVLYVKKNFRKIIKNTLKSNKDITSKIELEKVKEEEEEKEEDMQ